MRQGRPWVAGLLGVAAFAAPLDAQTTAADPGPSIIADLAIDSFYASRPGALVWLGDADRRAAAAKLAALLRRAAIDGLSEGPALAARVEAAIARGQPADDRIISAAWVKYVRVLKAPPPAHVIDKHG